MFLEQDRWSNLPSDLLQIIMSHLPLLYHPNFASVCKKWNAICTHKLYCINQANQHPLLVYINDLKSGIINYYSPIWNKTFKVKCPFAMSKSLLFNSRDGWLVMYKNTIEKEEEVEVVLYNPTINVSYFYPTQQHDYFFSGITFSGCPLTADFVIFGISSPEWHDDYVVVTLWKGGEWKFQAVHYDNQSAFAMSTYSCPVVYKGCFYCVSGTGKLGMFDPKNETWNILTHPKGFRMPICKEVYLIESEDSIKAVVGGNCNSGVLWVFYLNHKRMAWERKHSLDTQSMYIGPKASIIIDFKKTVYCSKTGKTIRKVDAAGKKMKNRVYTARLYGDCEEVEAAMKISEGRLVLETKTCNPGKIKDKPLNGSILSCSLQQPKTENYDGSSQYTHCAWYKPELIYSSKAKRIKKLSCIICLMYLFVKEKTVLFPYFSVALVFEYFGIV